jgi:hypothetical protein
LSGALIYIKQLKHDWKPFAEVGSLWSRLSLAYISLLKKQGEKISINSIKYVQFRLWIRMIIVTT